MTILDFTGACLEERLPEALSDSLSAYVDCRDVEGCRRLCDEAAAAQIRSRLQGLPSEGLHWIDSGDYHYLTAFWCAGLRRPFDLLLVDHHTDMQPAAFEGMLSCGSWVLEMLRHNQMLRHVVILGAAESLRCETEGWEGRVTMLSEAETAGLDASGLLALIAPHLSGAELYVSLDKDALAPSEYATNWDQGSLVLEPLCGLLGLLAEKIIGADLCGCTDFPSSRDLAADLKLISILS